MHLIYARTVRDDEHGQVADVRGRREVLGALAEPHGGRRLRLGTANLGRHTLRVRHDVLLDVRVDADDAHAQGAHGP